jgi:acyl-CoA synthetase (AMP-forming)/AMP-acid ligase II
MMAMILASTTSKELDFSFVRLIIRSTSPVSRKLYDNIKRVFTNASITVGYGLTEFGPAFGPPPPGVAEPVLSCGYPQKGVQYKLVDGVLHLKSESMSSGYSNSSKIVDGWLNTGDIFRVDENNFYFWVCRADDMYKVGGEQVYPSEVEASLENLEGVNQACVIMLEDDIKGFKPYAFCTGTFESDALITELSKTMPWFKIPRKIWAIDSMPLVGVGKIDRKLLIAKAKGML